MPWPQDLRPGEWAVIAATVGTPAVGGLIGLARSHSVRQRAAWDKAVEQARLVWISEGGYSGSLARPGLVHLTELSYTVGDGGAGPITDLRPGPATASPEELAASEPALRLLLAGHREHGHLKASGTWEGEDEQVPMQLIFRDATGRQWRRGSDGALEPWPPPPAASCAGGRPPRGRPAGHDDHRGLAGHRTATGVDLVEHMFDTTSAKRRPRRRKPATPAA